MTLQRLIQFARRWLWLLVLGPVVTAVPCYLVSLSLPRVYQSTAELLVTAGQPGNTTVDSNVVLAAERLSHTYAEIIKTRPVVDESVKAAGLTVTYEDALKLLDVTPLRDTQLIQITARADTPESAADLANQIVATAIQRTQGMQANRFAATKEAQAKQVDQLAADIAARISQLDVLRAQQATPTRDGDVSRLEFVLAQLQQSYAAALRGYEDARLSEARTSDVLIAVDAAAPVLNPVQPKILLNVLVAAVVGLLGASAAVQLIERNDDRLSSEERLARFTGLRALTTVPLLVGARSLDAKQALAPVLGFLTGNASTRAVESFRVLLANLNAAQLDRPIHTILVTSTDAGEGKTAVAAALAVVAAQAGKTVVLVDADLHRPSLHEWFSVEQQPGFLSLLIDDDVPAATALVATTIEGLRLLPGGRFPVSPSDLLASRLLRTRLAELRELADFVVLDSPPVLEVSDPVLLAEAMDATLLVVNAQRGRGHNAARAVTALRSAGARVVGAVLNGVPAEAPGPVYRQSGFRKALPVTE